TFPQPARRGYPAPLPPTAPTIASGAGPAGPAAEMRFLHQNPARFFSGTPISVGYKHRAEATPDPAGHPLSGPIRYPLHLPASWGLGASWGRVTAYGREAMD